MSDNSPSQPRVKANAEGIAHAADLIRAGKLVVLPTETVYGIAVNLASKEARDAARHMKAKLSGGTAAPSPWVIHVAQPDEILAWMPSLSPLAKRLINKSLPGPVAFEIKVESADEMGVRQRLGTAADDAIHEGFLTLRCPDFPTTQEVLKAVEAPVAIIGAGTLAQPGVFDAQEVPAELTAADGDQPRVELILDDGPTRYRRSSTVVRIEGEKYAITRPGVIDARILNRMADFTLLFLCSGNTCRSPMAAALAAKILADKQGIPASELSLRHVVVQSAGLHASKGLRATLEAGDAVKSLGADLSAHISQSTSPDLLRRADVIYTMTHAHRQEVMELYPWAERKTFRLDPEGDVSDPFGSPLPVYQRVAKRLMSLLEKRLSELPV